MQRTLCPIDRASWSLTYLVCSVGSLVLSVLFYELVQEAGPAVVLEVLLWSPAIRNALRTWVVLVGSTAVNRMILTKNCPFITMRVSNVDQGSAE